MLTTIIRSVIRFRWLVWTLTAALVALSVYALRNASLDAIPDIADPQVIVYSKWPRSPLVIVLGYLSVFMFGMCVRPLLMDPRRHWDAIASLVSLPSVTSDSPVATPTRT